jgi:hypothetical protein
MLTRNRAVLLLGLPATVVLVVVTWSGIGPLNWTENSSDLETILRGEIDVRPKVEAAKQRSLAKRAACVDLIKGRRKLEDVVDFFRRTDESNPEVVKGTQFYPGKTETERHYRMVIYWTKIVLEEEFPDKATSTLARLEAEMHRQLRATSGARAAQQ